MSDHSSPQQIQKLSTAEKWLADGLRIIPPPGALGLVDVDMSACASAIEQFKRNGIGMTYAPIFVWATARALASNPKLHQLIAGNKRLVTDRIDICLSIAGDATVTPVVIFEDAGRRNVTALLNELREKVPLARAGEQQMRDLLNKWGWLVPFGFVRRALLGFLMRQLWYKRKASGTFQISIVPALDTFVPMLFNTAAILGVGQIRERPVVVDGQVLPRLTATLACCVDHKVWNGMDLATFLRELKNVIENRAVDLPEDELGISPDPSLRSQSTL